MRGWVLRVAGDVAHPTVAVVGAGVAGVNGGELFCGRRSSGNLGVGVREHGRRSWGVLRTPEIAVSTSVGSDTSWGGCGHGHAMAGGERFSGKVVGLAREGGGARGEGNRVEGSPRFFWCCWRGRGGTGSGESTEGSFGGRRRNGDGGGVAGLPEGRGLVERERGSRRNLRDA